MFKILKFRQPYSLYESFIPPISVTRSTRHGSTYINIPANISSPHNSFTIRSPKIWNDHRIKLKISDFQISMNLVKANFKALLMSIKHKGNATEWNDENLYTR